MVFDGPTERQKRVAAMVLVSSRAKHIEACQRCADRMAVHLQTSVLDHVATKVARWRPFALLVDETLYEFDPREFSDLARDVGAILITLSANDDAKRLERDLMSPLTQAHQQRYSK